MTKPKNPKPKPSEIDNLDPWERPGFFDEDAEPMVAAVLDPDSEDHDKFLVKYPAGMKVSTHDRRAREKRNEFLEHLARYGSPKLAAKKVGLGERGLYLARQKYPDFEANWKMAKAIYMEFIADESVRKRAINGTSRAVWFQGKIVGFETMFDSGITQFYMKGSMPEKYGEKREISFAAGTGFGVVLLGPVVKDESAWEQTSMRIHAGQTIDGTVNKEPVPKKSVTIERQ